MTITIRTLALVGVTGLGLALAAPAVVAQGMGQGMGGPGGPGGRHGMMMNGPRSTLTLEQMAEQHEAMGKRHAAIAEQLRQGNASGVTWGPGNCPVLQNQQGQAPQATPPTGTPPAGTPPAGTQTPPTR